MGRSLLRVACAVFLSVMLLVPKTVLAFDTQPKIVAATAVCLTDGNGNVLYEKNADQTMAMASITKIMTAMVALDSGISLDTTYPFVAKEYIGAAQLAGYAEGDIVSLEELLMVTLVFSGNDAAYNVAVAVAGSQEAFVERMNEKAAAIGMTSTHFMNPHGLEEDGHYSCASDLCIMGRYAMEHYPFIRRAVITRSIDVTPGGYELTLYSTDDLMERYEGLRGIKTGRTESGYSFLGSARRGRVTLYSAVLCCEDDWERWDDTAAALDWGFSLYDERTLAQAGSIVRVTPWQDGFWLRCAVTPRHNVTGMVFDGGKLSYRTVMYKPGTLAAAGSTYGTTLWNQNGHYVGSVSYKTSTPATGIPAWNPFALPLVEGSEGLVS